MIKKDFYFLYLIYEIFYYSIGELIKELVIA